MTNPHRLCRRPCSLVCVQKLDVNVLRYLSKEDFRVLTAVEMGQKNVGIRLTCIADMLPAGHGSNLSCCLRSVPAARNCPGFAY
jgi:hypothetical protein